MRAAVPAVAIALLLVAEPLWRSIQHDRIAAETDTRVLASSWLRENADLTDDEEGEIASEIKKILNDAIKRADESPLPEAKTVTDGVFASPADLDTPHHK